MNQRQARDWLREPWIKQHTREPLDELLWPLMQRAVRQYLRTRSESDGTLIVDRDDPIDALVRALGAHEPEAALAREAVVELLRGGVLESDGRSIWMPERPASQVRTAAPIDEERAVPSAPPKPTQTSTDRVRAHRERKRNERNAQAVSSGVSALPEAVSASVPASRGDGEQVSPNSQKEQKEQTDTPHRPEDERASESVSPDVSPQCIDDEDDDETPVGKRNRNVPRVSTKRSDQSPTSLEEALRLEVVGRASIVVDRADLAELVRPELWPEVKAVAAAFAAARGCLSQPLGRYAQDNAVQQAVALYAAGYSQADLVHVVRAIARQSWTQGKGLGSLLTFKVVNANRPKPLVKSEADLSPNAAAVLARVRQGRAIREAG